MDQQVKFNTDLIKRYDVAGPRYTSYPTAVQFIEGFDANVYRRYTTASNNENKPTKNDTNLNKRTQFSKPPNQHNPSIHKRLSKYSPLRTPEKRTQFEPNSNTNKPNPQNTQNQRKTSTTNALRENSPKGPETKRTQFEPNSNPISHLDFRLRPEICAVYLDGSRMVTVVPVPGWLSISREPLFN